jgi:hypothetical protein
MRLTRFPALLTCLALMGAALHASPAQAAIVQVSVAGTVTGIDNHLSLATNPYGSLSVGDTVTGSWSYDTATPFGLVPISGTHFGYLVESMSFSTGGATGAFATFDEDRAVFNLPGSGRVFPERSYLVSLQFAPNYFNAIPPSALDMSAFLFGSIFGSYTAFPGSFISYTADVTRVASVSSVPIPSAIWLFLSSLLAGLGLKWSRQPRGTAALPWLRAYARVRTR